MCRTLLSLAALIAASLCVLRAADKPSSDQQPNILIVINDDQSWVECSAYGERSSVATPNFDRVAKSGVLFTHGYCGAPSCAPSRASLLTGRNFWELEQGAFIQAWVPAKFATLPEMLQPAGYHAGYTGKGWGPGVKEPTGQRSDPAGQAWNQIRIESPPAGVSNIDYASNFAAFLKARPKGKPFYFWAGLLEPHHPHGEDNYEKLGLPLEKVKLPAFTPDTPGVRRHRANYLYEVQQADRTLGTLLKLLEDQGELANTLVIVTADNGTPTPRAKSNVYDWGVRVPLAMMWPARAPAGRTVSDFVTFADLAPTILEAARVPAPPSLSGRSALNVLLSPASGRVDASRSFAVSGVEWHGDLPPVGIAARMIHDDRYHYIVNYSDGPRFDLTMAAVPDERFPRSAETLDVAALIGAHRDHPEMQRYVKLLQAPRPREELYDSTADPDQIHNLADDPTHAEAKQKMRAQLEAYQRQTGDPRITGQMETFAETLKFVQKRKSEGYSDEGAPGKAKPRKAKPKAGKGEKVD